MCGGASCLWCVNHKLSNSKNALVTGTQGPLTCNSREVAKFYMFPRESDETHTHLELAFALTKIRRKSSLYMCLFVGSREAKKWSMKLLISSCVSSCSLPFRINSIMRYFVITLIIRMNHFTFTTFIGCATHQLLQMFKVNRQIFERHGHSWFDWPMCIYEHLHKRWAYINMLKRLYVDPTFGFKLKVLSSFRIEWSVSLLWDWKKFGSGDHENIISWWLWLRCIRSGERHCLSAPFLSSNLCVVWWLCEPTVVFSVGHSNFTLKNCQTRVLQILKGWPMNLWITCTCLFVRMMPAAIHARNHFTHVTKGPEKIWLRISRAHYRQSKIMTKRISHHFLKDLVTRDIRWSNFGSGCSGLNENIKYKTTKNNYFL